MVEPRGPTGTVRGMHSHTVTALLAKLTLDLGRKFTRAEAAAWLRAREGLSGTAAISDTAMVEAMLHALDRSPGVVAVRGEARYTVDPAAVRTFMQHRTWRMSLPSVDTQSARMLLAIMTDKSQLTPMLLRLKLRLRTALEGLD